MSGHCANPISFNKKEIKIGRPEYSLTPPVTSDNISFLPYSPIPSSKWTSYVYHPLALYCHCIVGMAQNTDLFQATCFKEHSNMAVGKALRVTINFYKK